jgi:hypothetical protein
MTKLPENDIHVFPSNYNGELCCIKSRTSLAPYSMKRGRRVFTEHRGRRVFAEHPMPSSGSIPSLWRVNMTICMNLEDSMRSCRILTISTLGDGSGEQEAAVARERGDCK